MANLPATIDLSLSKPRRTFAIPLLNDNHRTWEDEDSFAQVDFHWEEIPTSGSGRKGEIIIAVAQHYTKLDIADVNRISGDIYQYTHLRSGDGIVGFDLSKRTGKAGTVTAISKGTRSVKARIQWLKEALPTGFMEALDAKAGIQKLPAAWIAEFFPEQSLFEDQMERVLEPIAAETHTDSRRLTGPKQDPGGAVELFYGTNRNQTGAPEADNFYGIDRDQLRYGRCEVSIPPGHKQGELERPRRILVWQRNENRNRHIMLSSVRELSETTFSALLQDAVAQSPEKSALVFIHGFNTSFAEAAWRTAQLVYDLPFNEGVAAFFSWPSTGRGVADYMRDGERAEASVRHLMEFIETLVEKGGLKNLHFIAHSMGNRILTRALNALAAKTSFQSFIGTIRQIILAAPDIDRDVFEQEILPAFQAVGTRRTLYISDEDRALQFSRHARVGLPRLGEGGTHIYVANGLDTVDASNVMSHGVLHHSYVFETKELLTDVHTLITQNLDPQHRRLRLRKKDALDYWLFPE